MVAIDVLGRPSIFVFRFHSILNDEWLSRTPVINYSMVISTSWVSLIYVYTYAYYIYAYVCTNTHGTNETGGARARQGYQFDCKFAETRKGRWQIRAWRVTGCPVTRRRFANINFTSIVCTIHGGRESKGRATRRARKAARFSNEDGTWNDPGTGFQFPQTNLRI